MGRIRGTIALVRRWWRTHGAISGAVIAWCAAATVLGGCAGATGVSKPPPSNVTVTIAAGSASVLLGGTAEFQATVTGTSNTAVAWGVDGIAGGNTRVGTIAASGAAGDAAAYTAPSVMVAGGAVTISAVSVAAPQTIASATLKITDDVNVSLAPTTASVQTNGAQVFTATITATAGATSGVAWSVNGVTGGNATAGTIAASTFTAGNGAGGTATAVYMAPAVVPSPASVTVTVTSLADAAKSANATLTITGAVGVSVTPTVASVIVSQRQTFTAAVSGTTNGGVNWTVNGIANGSATTGQICVTGSSPCAAPEGASTGSVDYLAPATIPSPASVTLMATSVADATKSASATVTVVPVPVISVTVAPGYAFVAPTAGAKPSNQQFYATVTNSTNKTVTWSVASAVTGAGCGGAACGTISASGMYTAPTAAPSPNAISVTATSAADSTKNASAEISITSGPTIEAMLPSSVVAGAVEEFPMSLEGAGFVAGSGSGASVILIDGVARGTTCAAATQCSTAIDPADVASAATLTIEVQNPGTPGALSNPVPFVIVPYTTTDDEVDLTSASPAATALQFAVTDPTTAAESAPISVQSIGPWTNGNNCTIGAAPMRVARPASGTETVSMCVWGNGLDASFTYTFTGPGATIDGTDIPVTATTITGLFSNMVELDLQISRTTAPGVRTLFITTLNGDRAAATGMLEVY
ncbi:MAG: hypothetical protein WBF56_13695 [Candidatus Acidiferrales bacterium]